MNPNTYFLPYQQRWLKDDSRIKIWEKSRRIGATYVQAYEDVRDCAANKVPAVWFSSADETAAREYILYCEKWAKALNYAAKALGEIIIDSDKDIKAFSIQFSNGNRINALSSNPTQFRSKGGKVVLDEYAFHKDQDAMWKAARPTITWGFPLRILSTYNGKGNKYFKFVDDTKKGKLKWSLHTTPIDLAVEEGLADKILKKALSPEERQAWIDEEEASVADDETWQQEYKCNPVDEATAFLSYELIHSCEHEVFESDETTGVHKGKTWKIITMTKPGYSIEKFEGDLFLGYDVGRKKDLSVLWLARRNGRLLETLRVITMEKTPFKMQKKNLYDHLKLPNMRRACIDETGIGMQLAEDAQDDFGSSRVEPVTFTSTVKSTLMHTLLEWMEDSAVTIPSDKTMRLDFHSFRKITTAAGNIRFDVEKSNTDGHGDRGIACALAIHASDQGGGEIHVASRARRTSSRMMEGY